MYRSLALLVISLLILSACAPAATPAPTSAPAAPTTAPVAQPTAAPVQAQPAVTPNATQGSPDLRPPVSGGPSNPPTIAPKAPNSQPNSTNRVKGWQQLGSIVVPSARSDHALVATGDFNRLVLFGGRSTSALNDTWVYDLSANAWHPVTTSIAPDARFGMGAAYDAARQRVLIFGGQSASRFFNDVWAFDVKTEQWSQINLTGSAPAARSGTSAVIDPAFDRLIISHGTTVQGRTDDTWSLALAGTVWQNISPAVRPTKRSQISAVFDQFHHRLILLGGSDVNDNPLNDQWSLDATAQVWRQFGTIGPNNPAPRSSTAAVYDPISNNIYLFGGKTSGGVSNEVWLLDPSNNWLLLAANSGPSARSHQAAGWDTINQRLIVFGGLDANNKPLNDLWAFTP